MDNQEAIGRFAWYDLMTTDTGAAVRFYTELFGWGTEEWKGQDMPYTMWKGPRGVIGGVMLLPEEAKQMGAPPNWMAYIITPNVDQACTLTTQLGGRVMAPPMDIPTVGRFAILQDPQGAVFAAFSAEGDAPDTDDAKEVGEVSWHELAAGDYEAAFTFYSKLFGWTKGEAMDMGPEMGGVYQLFNRGKGSLGGMFNKPAQMPGPPAWLYYFCVKDVPASIEKAKNLGATLLNGPMEVPGGDVVAQLMDPQGAMFAVHSIKG